MVFLDQLTSRLLLAITVMTATVAHPAYLRPEHCVLEDLTSPFSNKTTIIIIKSL